MDTQHRDFKGIWIPKEIWLDKRLTALDKIILAEIDSLDNEESGCYASNAYLADFCQCGETKVSTAISKLIAMDLLHIKSFDGRVRVLKSRLSKSENREADFQKVKPNNIDNNIKTNSKEKIYKREPKNELPSLLLLTKEYEFDDNMVETIKLFLEYKKEKQKGKTYTPTGFKRLLNSIHENIKLNGTTHTIACVNECMARNYTGLFFTVVNTNGYTVDGKLSDEKEGYANDYE